MHKAKKPAQKTFGHGRDSNPSSCLAAHKKSQKISGSRRSYMSVAVSGSQLIKLINSVTSLILEKKKKNTTIVCVLLRKTPTKNNMQRGPRWPNIALCRLTVDVSQKEPLKAL